ncbi:ZMYND19 [Bugula neritina]|uniref:ZMYND19 n=1 Tax=Bugula neritina TaxID=10212 RepID=A0A7J7J373_BUGNE|nr:ZMYND19 [Bugula neritina]
MHGFPASGLSDEPEQYCLINVGRAGGKLKLCLLDIDKNFIADNYHLKAVMTFGGDGGDPRMQVLAFSKADTECSVDRCSITPVQDIIWGLHHSRKLPSTQIVTHRNGNPMDNRLDNLTAVERCSDRKCYDVTSSTYNLCISELLPYLSQLNVPEALYLPTSLEETIISQCQALLLANQNYSIKLTCDTLANQEPRIYECHFLPCNNIERCSLQYSSCGGCRSVRYCSEECQRHDWLAHQIHCSYIQTVKSCAPLEGVQLSFPYKELHSESSARNTNKILKEHYGDRYAFVER